MDYRYRGLKLEVGMRTTALRGMAEMAKSLNAPFPSMDAFLHFIGERGVFKDSRGFDCSPWTFWNCLFADHSLADLGMKLTSLPSSQAGCERIFSAASWCLDGKRDKLSMSRMVRDVTIRVNVLALNHDSSELANSSH